MSATIEDKEHEVTEEKKGVSRRDFLIGSAIIGTSAALCVAGVSDVAIESAKDWYYDKPSDPLQIKLVSEYLNRRGFHTNFRDHGSQQVVYLLPDTHAREYQERHRRSIEVLINKFSVGMIGHEGHTGPLTKEMIEAEIQKALKDPLSCNIAAHEYFLRKAFAKKGQKIERPEIASLDDFFSFEPVKRFPYEGRVISVGLEDATTDVVSEAVSTVQEAMFPYFEAVSEFGSANKPSAMYARLSQSKQQKVRESMGKLRQLITKALPDLPEKLVLPEEDQFLNGKLQLEWIKKVRALYKNYVLDQRSDDAVHLLMQAIQTHGQDRAIMVYGEAHMERIKQQLDSAKVSYIEFYTDRNKKIRKP